MPNLTSVQFQNNIVKPGAGAPPAVQTLGATNHYLRYDLTHLPAATRCTHDVQGVNPLGMPAQPGDVIASYRIVFTPAATGDTFFLPFNNNQIHSVALPSNPGLADVRYVFTVNLSGCAAYVDDDPTNNLVYFHHANCIGGLYSLLNPTAHKPSKQLPLAIARLNQLHNHALANFGWAPTAVPRSSLLKSQYYATLDTERSRKRGQLRSNVEAWAGTTAWGFYNGAAWEFWYQTFGAMTYNRPWLQGANVTIMNKKPDALWDVQQFG